MPTVSETTVSLAALALVVIGGTLVWTRVGDLLVRVLGVGSLVFAAGLMVAEAPAIVAGLGGEPGGSEEAVAARFDRTMEAFLATEDSDAAALVRELLEIDPALYEEVRSLVLQAGGQPDPQAFLMAGFYRLGSQFSQQLLPRLVSASDESFQRLAMAIAPATDRLPSDDAGCLAIVRDGGSEWTAELHAALPGLGDDLVTSLLAVVREAKSRPPTLGLGSSDMRFLQEQMTLWMEGAGRDDMAHIMALGGGGGEPTPGMLCGLVRGLFRHIAEQPAPQGGRLLRVLFTLGVQGA